MRNDFFVSSSNIEYEDPADEFNAMDDKILALEKDLKLAEAERDFYRELAVYWQDKAGELAWKLSVYL